MSSVVISGNTSGAITLSAPDVSGTNTATLPAATGTVMVSGNMPAFSAYATATQSVTSGVATKVILNAEDFDTASAFDSTTNYRFQPTIAGYYIITASFRPSGAALTSAYMGIYKNGSIYARVCEGAIQQVTVLGSIVLYLNGSSDYLELYGVVNATSPSFDAAGVSNGAYGCRMTGSLIRAA